MARIAASLLVCGFVLVCGARAAPPADTEGRGEDFLPYRECSTSGTYAVDFFPPAGDTPAYGRCQHRPTGRVAWYVTWYAPGVALAEDGEHLVQYGRLVNGRQGQATPILSFWRAGKALKRYSADDLQRLQQLAGSAAQPGDAGRVLASVAGLREGGKVFVATLAEGTEVTFDVATGEVLRRTRRDTKKAPAEVPLEPLVCRGYRVVAESRPLSRAFTAFAQRLYGDVARTRPGENLVLSPSDLASNLVLVATGARGQTEEELRRVLLPGWPAVPAGRLVDSLAMLHEAAGLAEGSRGIPNFQNLLAGVRLTPAPRNGLVVAGVDSGSPLRDQLQPGDRITTVAGRPAASAALEAALASGAESVALGILRPGAERSVPPVVVRLRPPVMLQSVVSLWVGKETQLHEDFTAGLDRFGPHVLHRVDFADAAGVARQVNAAIARATRNRISQLIDPAALGEQAEVVLAGATYLAGPWKVPFDLLPDRHNFHGQPGRPIRVPMMRATDTFRLLPHVDFDLLELPLQGDRLTLLVLLPGPHTTLDEAETLLATGGLPAWLHDLDQVRRRTVEVTLPPFTLQPGRQSLTGTLQKLGVQTAFQADAADFSGLARAPRLRLSEVQHQAYLRVDEHGLEAAAATSSIFQPRAGADERIHRFHVDRPFLFLVRDRVSHVLFFLGRVVDPGRES